MKLSKNVSVNSDWIESLTSDKQLEWIESVSISDEEKEECKKQLKTIKNNDKRVRDKGKVKKTKSERSRAGSGEDSYSQSRSEGSKEG